MPGLPYQDKGGGGPNPPAGTGFFDRIINVHWPKTPVAGVAEFIVVFVTNTVFSTQPDSSIELLTDKATHLATWRSPYQAAGFQPGFPSHAYHVHASADPFIRFTLPSPVGDLRAGYWLTILAFAIMPVTQQGGIINKEIALAASLERAIEGTKLTIPASYRLYHSDSDIPYDFSPPGLLWHTETGEAAGSQQFTFVARFGNHRTDKDVTPPNQMAQCYFIDGPYTVIFGADNISWSGYLIHAYRLDADGTGTVYGEIHPPVEYEDSQQNIDGAWHQPLSDKNDFGIPSQDPPPLISADVV